MLSAPWLEHLPGYEQDKFLTNLFVMLLFVSMSLYLLLKQDNPLARRIARTENKLREAGRDLDGPQVSRVFALAFAGFAAGEGLVCLSVWLQMQWLLWIGAAVDVLAVFGAIRLHNRYRKK